MYRAKAQGKHRAAVFQPAMHTAVRERLAVEADLRRLLDGDASVGRLVLHYQPIVDLKSGALSHVEALVRWEHPARGVMPPKDFITIAEDSGMIVALERWVLREACRQTRDWRDRARHDATAALTVSVNVSARHFASSTLVGDVSDALAASGLPAGALVLELTESMLVHDVRVTLSRMRELRALGVRLALDDFGTGYSSLAYLEHFPIDLLKIDRSFVAGIGRAGGGTSPSLTSPLVAAVLGLGRALKMGVVAEGIETQAQLDTLVAGECQYGQGFLLSRPQPAEQLEAMLGVD
jgi:EAL domain-containing protein (putative c-di-GMP-specific phosphodiesterase class I)